VASELKFDDLNLHFGSRHLLYRLVCGHRPFLCVGEGGIAEFWKSGEDEPDKPDKQEVGCGSGADGGYSRQMFI
jgi:hypothetical protein